MSFWRVRRGPKLPTHKKSSIRGIKVRRLKAFNELPMKSPSDLGNDREGLNSGLSTILLDCLPMGGIGSLYSNPSLEYRQPPEREAKLW